MSREQEILAVKQLGESIGYGNMMDIASALWAESLANSYGEGTVLGAFMPTVLPFIDKKEHTRMINRQNMVRQEIRNLRR